MNDKKKYILNIVLVAGFLLVFAVAAWLKPETRLSVSERRKLKTMPVLSVETVLGKKQGSSFMDDFEVYAKDQFPFREHFRMINALGARYLLGRKEVNDLYVKDGYIAKLEDGIHEKDLAWAAGRFDYILDRYYYGDSAGNLKDNAKGNPDSNLSANAVGNSNINVDSDNIFNADAKSNIEIVGKKNKGVFLAIIPDKSCYLAQDAGVPYLDVSQVEDYFKSYYQGNGKTSAEVDPSKEDRYLANPISLDSSRNLSLISIKELLHKEDYYYTDTHWRQEKLGPVAARLLSAMGRGQEETLRQMYEEAYTAHELDLDFYGVYHGQAALPLPPEKINYLTWDGMEDIKVLCYDSGSPLAMELYDQEKLAGDLTDKIVDPYEYFLSGSKALITMENPAVKDGELVVFRDSFGSSLAPLLSAGYKKVTLVDIRYISPAILGRFVDFSQADILFLYSTTVLNNCSGQFLK